MEVCVRAAPFRAPIQNTSGKQKEEGLVYPKSNLCSSLWLRAEIIFLPQLDNKVIIFYSGMCKQMLRNV